MAPVLFGYVDPGSGTLLLQGLIAALCGGALFAGRRLCGWLVAFWRRKPATSDRVD